ncbi:MAG TPA: hypothetical protein VMH36_15825 [Alphaproteobacteria bacterium]|nr:hypothetical protein [Alphaproteobacteria bacterium]
MAVLSRFAACVAAVLALSACDPRFVHESDLNAHQVSLLAGTWSGKATMTFSNRKDCPRTYLWRMTVADGTVNGEVVNADYPDAAPSTYSSFVEYDGTMHADLRTRGADLYVLGAFDHDGFNGTARTKDCNYIVTLRHEGGGGK